jgi:DNA-binding transcriptional regulator YiaG
METDQQARVMRLEFHQHWALSQIERLIADKHPIYNDSEYLRAEIAKILAECRANIGATAAKSPAEQTAVHSARVRHAAQVRRKKNAAEATPAQIVAARGTRTQTEIAELLGVSRTTVQNWENGRSPISRVAWQALQRTFASFP